jgi:hypothetical protein
MPLPEPKAKRDPLHLRDIEIRGYKREDGLYDIEGHLTDTKAVDYKLAQGIRPAGAPIHSMWLRLTIDRTLTIVDAEAWTEAMPYLGACDQITPDYKKLVGVAMRAGYHRRINELLGGVRGCTHLTELAGAMATAAFQTLAGQGLADPERKPFQLDRCHALESSTPLVAKFYPKWYTGNEPLPPAGEPERH